MKVTIDRRRLKQRMIEEDKNSLIKALKNDDAQAAKQALTGMSGEDLGLTHDQFRNLAQDLDFAAHYGKTKGFDLERVRKLLGIQGTNTPQHQKDDPNITNPFTGKPWPSGPVKQGQQNDTLAPDELNLVHAIVGEIDSNGNFPKSLDDLKSDQLGYLYRAVNGVLVNPKYKPIYDSLKDKVKKQIQKKYPGMVSYL